MTCMIRLLLTVPLVALAAATAAAKPAAVFGPTGFELTAGETEEFTESFVVEAAGPYVLHLRNGDADTSRVDGAVVSINGSIVVGAGEVGVESPGVVRPVEVAAGENQIAVALDGAPGSFVTIAIAAPGPLPVFVAGRLLLPWGRDDDARTLTIALRNGSPRFPRRVRVVFFRPDGSVAAASDHMALPPRASIARAVDDWIDHGSWQVGSVEVFYTGPGTARLFGSARQVDLPPGTGSEVEPLASAGIVIARPPASADDRPPRPLRR